MKDIKQLGPSDLRALEQYAVNELMKLQELIINADPSETTALEEDKLKVESRLSEIDFELKMWIYG